MVLDFSAAPGKVKPDTVCRNWEASSDNFAIDDAVALVALPVCLLISW